MPQRPSTAYELCQQAGIGPEEGVVISIFPPRITGLCTGVEHYYYAQWVQVQPILAEFGTPGNGHDLRLIDLLPDPVNTKIKWWKVRGLAQGASYSLVSEHWNGAARDIPARFFEAGADGKNYLGVRLYNSGPWFWPLDRPEMVLEETEEDAAMAEAAKEYKL